MKRTRIVAASTAVIGLVALVPLVAFAHEEGVPVRASVSVGSAGVNVNVGSSSVKVDIGDDSDEDSSSTGVRVNVDHDEVSVEAYAGSLERMGEVAKHVQLLLRAADRDGGIGVEVRAIAHELASSTERADKAKEEVHGRPGWLTFLIGTDYGNLGKLRSEVSTTQNSIARLQKAADRATDATVKADLVAQIDALKLEASTTETFIMENEDTFSLFGWFVRIFSR